MYIWSGLSHLFSIALKINKLNFIGMKHAALFLIFAALNFSLLAQSTSVVNQDSTKLGLAMKETWDPKSVNGISFKRAFIDYKSAQAGSAKNLGDFRQYNSGFEVGYLRDFTKNIRLYVPVRLGVFNLGDNQENITFGELDAQLQYRFIPKKGVLRPYILGGAGVNSENLDTFNMQIPLGAGLDIKIAKKTFINVQGEYRISLNQPRNNIQLSIGFIHYFGKANAKTMTKEPDVVMKGKDSDGDGIPDDLDLCPDKPGLQQYSGCPDTDGDGLEDTRDLCPEVPGLKALNGCPDSDGDGVADKDDDCPNLAGTKANRGCPSTDTDNDGVVDDLDDCPTVAGSPSARGCPDRDGDGVADKSDKCPNLFGKSKNGCPDTDGDGVDDGEDRCPNTKGPVSNKGCPEIKQEDKDVLNIAMRDVQFEHNSATLRNDSYPILDQISKILATYPEYKIEISGHTDNTGTPETNKKLSEQRARACRDYLISKGMAWSRVASRGFGQTKPIASNDTQQGRATNRRVEFKLYLE
jgi:outer membrane protein OmpA-like peptidoglycan-associated protein